MAIANSSELSESDGGSADSTFSTLKLFGQRIPLTHSPAQSTEVSMEAHKSCKNRIDSEGIDEEEGENTSPSSNLESKTCKGIEESKQNRSDQITMAVVSEQSKGLPENARLNKQKSGHNMSEETPTPKKPDKPIPCPRCESLDTKFCYFNNYNVNQPRHFCKQCQRYWTAGGTLRNVPVGAGRRKNKHSMAAAQWQNMHQQADLNLSSNSSDVGADEAQDSVMRLTMMLNHKVCAASSKAEICAPKSEQAEEIQQMHQSRALLADAAVQSGIGIGSDQQPVNNQTLKREGCDGSLAQVQVPVQVQPTKEENIQNMTNVEAKTTPPAGGYVNSSWPVSWSNGASPPPPPCTVTIPVNQEGGAVMQIPFPWNPSMAGMWGPTWPGMEAAAAAAVAMAPHLWASWGGAIWNNPWGAAAAAGYAAAAAAAAASLGNSGAKGPSVLGKHGREKEGDAAPAGVYAPKTLRIDDPGEAARSSIWTTLGIKAGSSMPFKGFQSTSVKSSEDKSVEAASRINPAAMSRSATFQENH